MFKSDIDEIILVLNEMECFFVSHKYMKQVQLMRFKCIENNHWLFLIHGVIFTTCKVRFVRFVLMRGIMETSRSSGEFGVAQTSNKILNMHAHTHGVRQKNERMDG